MKHLVAALAMLSQTVAPPVAGASEQSERLYSRGLAAFHAGLYPQALELFDQAVAADPADAEALYYRGVTRGRLRDLAGAEADLRAALALEPDLDQAKLELGVVLFEAARYREAAEWLVRAQDVAALEARASFFRGLAQLRLGLTADAQRNLQRAAGRDPELRLPSLYYQGVAAYREGKWSEAREHLSAVAEASPESAIGREAAAVLAKLAPAEIRPYFAYGAVGFQYDSNVVLAPADEAIDQAVGITRQADGRAILDVGAVYTPWRTARMQLSLGYEFYQSLQFRLTDFNLQDHRPNVQFLVDMDVARFGLLARYDFYLLGDDSFLNQVYAAPWVQIPEGTFGRTDVFYRMDWRDYLKSPFEGVLDGFYHRVGVQQLVYLGAATRYLFAGYQYEHEDPTNASGDPFAYDGNRVEGGVGWAFPADVSAEASYAYQHQRYAAASNGRRDNRDQIIAVVRKQLNDHLAVTAAYLGTINNSNQAPFEYDRNIASVALEGRF